MEMNSATQSVAEYINGHKFVYLIAKISRSYDQFLVLLDMDETDEGVSFRDPLLDTGYLDSLIKQISGTKA